MGLFKAPKQPAAPAPPPPPADLFDQANRVAQQNAKERLKRGRKDSFLGAALDSESAQKLGV